MLVVETCVWAQEEEEAAWEQVRGWAGEMKQLGPGGLWAAGAGGGLPAGCAGRAGTPGSGTAHLGSSVPLTAMPLKISGPDARAMSTRHMLYMLYDGLQLLLDGT